jgi:hypothetical protein
MARIEVGGLVFPSKAAATDYFKAMRRRGDRWHAEEGFSSEECKR